MEIIITGSSSGFPSSDRASASFILDTGKEICQFDAGEGIASSLLRYEIDHLNIRTIIISHCHADHMTGLFLEIQLMYLAKRKEPLTIIVPSEIKDILRQFLNATYLFSDQLGFDITIKPVQPDPVYRSANITVYARLNSHLTQYREIIERNNFPNKMQSYSYVVKTDDKRILYSGDIGSLDDYVDLLPGCDLLITEGMHLDLKDLFQKLAENKVKNTILTHLPDSLYKSSDYLVNLARKYGIKNVHIAHDGLRLDI